MRHPIYVVALALLLLAPTTVICQKNILFLAADDLRPNLASYQDANAGMLFF